MKRFYVAAAIAASLLATSCQKTYVIDEVRTPIGFSTEVGKQTKAIVNNDPDNPGAYPDGQPFGVFAYGLTGNASWSTAPSTDNEVMKNVIISYTYKAGDEGEKVWKATDGKTYYWPNDVETSISFFAYSPYSNGESGALGQTPTFDKTDGIKLTDYVHNDYQGDHAVDFMVAETLNQKYTGTDKTTAGKVNIEFAHKMSQIIFTVAKAGDLGAGIKMKLISLSLNKVNNKADFSVKDGWTNQSGETEYSLFAAESDSDYKEFSTSSVSTTPVTMIPQNLGTQEFKIKYSISGDGLANEDVTKTITIPTTPSSWGANQKITYKITIGMNQITFSPTVVDWNEYDSNASEEGNNPVGIEI